MKKPDYSFQKPLMKEIEKHLLNGDNVCLAGTCGSGKTVMALKIANKLVRNNKKILILTHGQVLIRKQWASYKGFKSKSCEISKNKDLLELFDRNNIFYCLPQTLNNIPENMKFDLIIVDEAHERFFAKQVTNIIRKTGSPPILCLTGSPSQFIKDGSWKIVGVAFEDLIAHGVATAPEVSIAISDFDHKMSDYNSRQEIKDDISFAKDLTESSMGLVLESCVKYLGLRAGSGWKDTLNGLGKTMIACRNQELAKSVYEYLDNNGVSCVISISDFGGGDEALRQFKEDDSVKLFIVVRRGVLGLDYPDLCNVIDMTYSANVTSIFQLLSRVTRRGEGAKKLFLKLTSKEMLPVIYWSMSYVVALWTKAWFFAPIDKKVRIPLNKSFVTVIKSLETKKLKDKSLSHKVFEDIPKLLTFRDIAENMENLSLVARASFNEVCSAVYGEVRYRTLPEAIEAATKYSSRAELLREDPSLYAWFVFHKLLGELDRNNICPGSQKRSRTLESATAEAQKHASRADLVREDPSLYYWFVYKKEMAVLAEFFPVKKPPHRRTLEEALAEAKEYSSRTDLIKRSRRLYSWFHRHKKLKYLDDIYPPMAGIVAPMTTITNVK